MGHLKRKVERKIKKISQEIFLTTIKQEWDDLNQLIKSDKLLSVFQIIN